MGQLVAFLLDSSDRLSNSLKTSRMTMRLLLIVLMALLLDSVQTRSDGIGTVDFPGRKSWSQETQKVKKIQDF